MTHLTRALTDGGGAKPERGRLSGRASERLPGVAPPLR